jgi:hypothetical protein
MSRALTIFVTICALAWIGPAPLLAQAGSTQPPATSQQPPMQAQEIYHVHFVKAAPGKAQELANAYLAPPPGQTNEEPPIVLRHVYGDDWDLAVITPMGKEQVLRAGPMPEAEQQATMRMRDLRVWHGDTFTLGPAWTEARAKLTGAPAEAAGEAVGTAGSADDTNAFYTVTVYRSLPGHRDQLAQVLSKIAAMNAQRTVTLQHMEGAPWEFLMVSRYDSWAKIEEEPSVESMKAQGFDSPEALSRELRMHLAEHRDTITQRVMGPAAPMR